jgi:hypothetical protein
MTVNRLATPLPDSVLDRYYAEHPEEVDHRQHKHGAKVEQSTSSPQPDERDFQQVFDI